MWQTGLAPFHRRHVPRPSPIPPPQPRAAHLPSCHGSPSVPPPPQEGDTDEALGEAFVPVAELRAHGGEQGFS